MKATGIVRRIDDLGRIVIPKEIRRTLRIRESDPLEIFTDRVSGQMTLIADRDQFIAAAGGCKALMGKSISKALEEYIENRESILAAKGDKNFIQVTEEGEPEFIHEAISPIICEGDVIGAVLLLNNDPKLKMGEVEQKLILSAAGFLGRQMEQ